MQPVTIQFAVRVGYVRTIRISRENNIIQIDLPDGSTSTLPLACLSGRCLGYQRRMAELFLTISVLQACCAVTTEYGIPAFPATL